MTKAVLLSPRSQLLSTRLPPPNSCHERRAVSRRSQTPQPIFTGGHSVDEGLVHSCSTHQEPLHDQLGVTLASNFGAPLLGGYLQSLDEGTVLGTVLVSSRMCSLPSSIQSSASRMYHSLRTGIRASASVELHDSRCGHFDTPLCYPNCCRSVRGTLNYSLHHYHLSYNSPTTGRPS
jgi:hypothetical protein